MATIGASIILWYLDERTGMPMLLVGKESVYVKDLCDENYDFNERFGGLISEKEVFNTEHLSHLSESDKLKEAKLNFSRQALELEKILGLGPIKFDTLEEAKTEDGYTVNFRYLPRSFTPFHISNADFKHLQIHKLLSSFQLILQVYFLFA
jgi:hypothetical protein